MLQPICGYVLDVVGLKTGLRDLRRRVVVHQHGARPGPQLDGALLAARTARARRRLGQPRGDEGDLGVVPGAGARPGRRRLQHRRVVRVDARAAARGVGDHLLQLADGVRPDRRARPRLGRCSGSGSIESPAKHTALSDEERQHILSGQEQHLQGDGTRPSIGRILAQRNFWGIALPRFLADPTWGTLTFWLPLYLTNVRHFDLKQIALFAWLPFLAADLGCLSGGTISLALQKRFGISLINARRGAFTVGACLMVGVAFVGLRRQPLRRDRAAQPRRLRAPDAVGHGHHDVLGPLQAERGRDRRGHGGHVRQRRRADLLAADGHAWSRGSATRRSSSDSRRSIFSAPSSSGRSSASPDPPVPPFARGSGRLIPCLPTRRASAIRSCRASIPIRPSSGSATTTTSPRRRSSGSPACRFITRATSSTGGC